MRSRSTDIPARCCAAAKPTASRRITITGLFMAALLAVSGAWPASQAMAQPDQRIAYAFDESSGSAVLDSSTNLSNATATSTTRTSAGRYGSALLFDGSSSRVRSDAAIALATSFTFSAWVLNPSRQSRETIMTLGPDRSLVLDNGVIEYDDGTVGYAFGSAQATNTWHHISLVSTGATVRAYRNGVQQGSTRNISTPAVTGQLQVGADFTSSTVATNRYSGTIDEVRVHNRALSTAELTADQNTAITAGSGGGSGLGAWTSTTGLPAPRSANGAVTANGFIYLVGGIDGSGAAVPTVYVASTGAGSVGAWSSTTPLPVPVRSVRPVIANGYLYVAGGSDGNSFSATVHYAPINANGTLGNWATTTPLPQAQLSHATVASGGYLYVVGGNPGTCIGTVISAPINANGTIGAWTATTPLPAARCGFVEGVTESNGYLYAVAGYDNVGLTDTVLYARLNGGGALGAWQTNATTVAGAREYHGLEAVNGRLIVIAGQLGLFDTVSGNVEQATINADGSVGPFSAGPSLPAPRGYLGTASAGSTVYAVGGGTGLTGAVAQSSVYAAVVGPYVDTVPPVRSAGAPSGSLTAGTTQTTVSLTTNEAATCRLSNTPGTAYAAMTSTFATTGGTGHSTAVSGLQNGQSYAIHVRCSDAAGNADTDDYTITFSVGVAGDTTPPTVSVTAPAAGAAVSGTVTITATAADDVGVAGVQFLVDGTTIGAEDTTAPYSASWGSEGVTNGAHTITARARDAAGNQTTSAGVGVTVGNAGPSPLRAAYGFGEGTGATVNDASAADNDATATNPTWTAAGRYGNGIVFGGATRVRSNAAVDLAAAFTLQAWVLNPTNESYETIMTVGSNRDVYLGGGTLNFFDGATNLSFGPALATGTWQHVAIVSDGTTVRAYVDGVQRGTTQNLTQGATTGVVQVGAWIYQGADVDFFTGSIDEVRVHNRALSAAEIQSDAATPVGP